MEGNKEEISYSSAMFKLRSVLRVKAEFLHLSGVGAGVDQGPLCRKNFNRTISK